MILGMNFGPELRFIPEKNTTESSDDSLTCPLEFMRPITL